MSPDPADPRLAEARRAFKSGAFDQAIGHYDAFLESHPAHRDALIEACEAYRQFNRNDRAVELYIRAVEAEPNNPDLHAGLVEALLANSETSRAREVAEAAMAVHPTAAILQLLYAQTDLVLGRQDQARATFWKHLAIDPESADCALQLAPIVPDDELPKLMAALETMWAKRSVRSIWNAATLGFAYGRTAERLKKYEPAWQGYSFGASNRRKLVHFNETTYARTHDLHRKSFNRSRSLPDEDENPGAGFVFIVSLPRAGSTLVEQILDAHPRVEAIGERSFVYDTMTEWDRRFGGTPERLFSTEAIRAAREDYIGKARDLVGVRDATIVDKSINNYVFLGFIRTILPGARFVHVVRHPLDTGVSCYTSTFFAGNEWTYDLAEIGRNIRRYERIMGHWINEWPDDILSLRYEDLVKNLEPNVRELLKFCRLGWDPACLKFYESERPVLTASLNQVRQPIYQTAKGRAAHYEAHLGPMIAAMGKKAAEPDWYLKFGKAG